MAKQFINFNGEPHPEDHPVMTIQNRGFRYGDGLFESMRLMKGELKFASLHADRLQKGMKALKFEGFAHIDAYFLKEKVEELARRNKTGPNARARLTVFRDSGGLYSPSSNKVGYGLEVRKIEDPLYISDPKGLITDVFTDLNKPINPLSNFKTCNSLVYVLAGVFKNQFSLDDVFILNQNGFLCEAMSSNLFVVYQKQVYTPALTEGCIGGVMRAVVLQLAKENGLPVIEAQIDPAILKQADEVFLTNASRGIQWVMGYNKKRYFNEVSRFLLDKLNTASQHIL
jgi:branched-subunit amino acid aminotransferase/4-amino-4-deoxychorismate lyase